MDLTEFNEIRPYNDEELPQIFEELIADPAFRKAATGAIPNVPFELLAQKMRTCKTKLDFQKAFCPFSGRNRCLPESILLWYFVEDSRRTYKWADIRSQCFAE